MPRISGLELAPQKKISIALTRVFGVGRIIALKILKKVAISPSTKVADLKDEDIVKIQKALDQYNTEGNLRRILSDNLKRLQNINCYRGLRHRQGLPSRGQRTRSNARTRRGKRRTIGAMKKDDAAAKTESANKDKK